MILKEQTFLKSRFANPSSNIKTSYCFILRNIIFFCRTEFILFKKYLNKDNLRIWKVKSKGVTSGPIQPSIKKQYEVKKENIPNNPFWNTNKYPRYF